MPRWLLSVVVLIFASGGCGFALNGPDPQRPRAQMPRCDTSKGAVVVDGIMATLAGVIALSVAGTSEPAIALVPAGIGAIYLGGAIHGNRVVNECHEAMNDYEQAVAARGTLANTPAPVDESDEDQPPPRRPLGPPGQQRVPRSPGQQRVPQPPDQQMVPQQPGPPPVAGAPPPLPSAPQGPAPQVPVQAPAPVQPPAAKKPPPPRDDEWSDFWREVQ